MIYRLIIETEEGEEISRRESSIPEDLISHIARFKKSTRFKEAHEQELNETPF